MSCRTYGRIALVALFTFALLVLVPIIPQAAAQLSFTRVANSGNPGPGGSGPIAADLNNDGREDLIGSSANGISVPLANGDGTYAAAVDYTGAESAYFITVGDFNGDGWLDIITTSNSASLYEWLNNGDGTFRMQARFGLADD